MSLPNREEPVQHSPRLDRLDNDIFRTTAKAPTKTNSGKEERDHQSNEIKIL